MKTRKVTLAELETEARAEEERKIEEAEAHARAEVEAKENAEAVLAADVANWLADNIGLDPASIQPWINVSLDEWAKRLYCSLDVEGHTSIIWEMVIGEGGLTLEGHNPYGVLDYGYRVLTLAEALLRSADAYNEQVQRQAEYEKREEAETASWEAHQQKRADQGQHYLDLIASYPVLGPILEMLAVYIGDIQQYEASMAAAENHNNEIQTQMAAKLHTVQVQARELADEVDRAKSAQREAEERARRNQRSYPHDLCRA